MSLTPDWAPNIHPLVIHFPIALLVAAAMTDLAGILLRDRTSVRDAASLLYTAGAVCAVVAYFTGHHAGETVLLPEMANVLVNEHADWAFRATWFFVFFASIRLALSFIIRVPGYTATLVSFAAGFVGLYLLFETAERGGRLVFEHGVGVQAASPPSAERPATSNDAVSRELVDPEAGVFSGPVTAR